MCAAPDRRWFVWEFAWNHVSAILLFASHRNRVVGRVRFGNFYNLQAQHLHTSCFTSIVYWRMGDFRDLPDWERRPVSPRSVSNQRWRKRFESICNTMKFHPVFRWATASSSEWICTTPEKRLFIWRSRVITPALSHRLHRKGKQSSGEWKLGTSMIK